MEQKEDNKKTILVTGGAGFIGSHLVKALIKEGHNVISLDNYFSGIKNSHIKGAEYREGHTKDIEKHITETPDIVYHLGEYARVERSLGELEIVWDLNIVGTFAVFEFCRNKNIKIVYAGSSTKFGDGGLSRCETPYAWTKAANTELIKNYGKWFGLKYAIVYFYNVYGVGERGIGNYATLIGIFKNQFLSGAPLSVVSPGTQKRNFTHIDDIIKGLLLIGQKGEGEEYDLGSEEKYSVLEVAKMFKTIFKMLPERRGNRMDSEIDLTKSKQIGWSAEKRLKDYIEEIIQNKKIMNKKKILIFSLAYYPKFVGGAEVAIKEITDRISPKQTEFHMVTLRFDSTLPKKEQVGNVLVHRIGFSKENPSASDLKSFPLKLNKMIFQFSAFWYALKLHRKNEYDAIWAMMAHSAGVPAGLFKTFKRNVTYILTLQEGDPIPYIKKKMLPLYPLFKRAFTLADVVQSISNYLGTWARNMGFDSSLEIIPNAVNTKHFSKEYSQEELNKLKKELHKKEGDVFLITTSRLVEKNAVDDVIKSLSSLSENIKFLILGEGPNKKELKQLAEKNNVSKRVKFLGNINHNEMPKYLNISDIFIRPSISEGMGNSFLEAMAARLPVIATQEGGIADFLFDPERNPDKKPTGRAVAPKNSDDIARTVRLYLENPLQTAEIVQNAREMVFKEYDWDKIAIDMQTCIYNKV